MWKWRYTALLEYVKVEGGALGLLVFVTLVVVYLLS